MMVRLEHVPTRVVVATLVIWALAHPRATGPAAMAKGEDVTSTWLYQLEPHYDRTLQPLHPLTLTDMPALNGVPLGPVGAPDPYAWTLTSANGSTVARVSYLGGNATQYTRPEDITVHVFDVATGIERARFHPRVPILAQGLSPDGAQLYGPRLAPIGKRTARHAVWYAISTSTGRTLHTVPLADGDAWPAAYDYSRGRLYAMDVHPFDRQTHRPQTPSILAYDVQSGNLLARLNLPGVLAGSGATGREANGQTVYGQWSPGIALSPDGQRLALLDGNTQTLLLIDASSLEVAKTEPLTHPASVLARLGDWLGILPQAALAKGGEGVVLSVRFSSDERRLYIEGRSGSFDASGKLIYQDLGLQVVDVDSGEIVAQAQQDGLLGFSPDGRWLYTLSGSTNGQGWILRRDDALTLSVMAERTFDSYPTLVLMPGG